MLALSRFLARRGTLSASGNNGSGVLDTVSTLNSIAGSSESWSLDAVGNWNSSTKDGTTTSRTHDSQNELTGVGSNSLTFDANGNTTVDDQGHHLKYDAWNRLVSVKDSGNTTTLDAYSYDAQGRRITENPGTLTDLYLTTQSQVLEEQQSGVTIAQNIWGIDYVNSLVARDSFATAGALDASFKSTGKIVNTTGNADTQTSAVLAQEDGKIIAVANTSGSNAVIARYQADGSLDSTFGTSGYATFSGYAMSATLDSSGNILVAGLHWADMGVWRFSSSGTADSSFGSSGAAYVDFGGYEYANDMALQSDGKIVITGIGGGACGIARLNADGSLDSSFDSDGKLVISFPGVSTFNNEGQGVVIQPSGKIVVAGTAYSNTTGYNSDIFRLDSDGTLDTSFGSGGWISFTGNYAWSVKLDALTGGDLIVGEYGVLYRYTADGDLDGGFGVSGVSDSTSIWNYALAVQPDGKVVVGGAMIPGGVGDWGVARYNADGTLDDTFGTGGVFQTHFGASSYSQMDRAQAVCVQADGQILVGGSVDEYGSSTQGWALIRLNGGVTRLYAQHDANYNITALVNPAGAVVERFVQDPYGNPTVLDASSATTTDLYHVPYAFQGGRVDAVTGTIYFGGTGLGRNYRPSTGTWDEADRGDYIDGLDRYQGFESNPVNRVDPTGYSPIIVGQPGRPSGSGEPPPVIPPTTQPTTPPSVIELLPPPNIYVPVTPPTTQPVVVLPPLSLIPPPTTIIAWPWPVRTNLPPIVNGPTTQPNTTQCPPSVPDDRTPKNRGGEPYGPGWWLR